MNKDLLIKYARLAVKKGINIQKDQLLVINSPIECSEFARIIANEAYNEGASDVVINYNDEKFSRIRFMNASKETLSFTPSFEKDRYDYYVDKGAAFLSISASDPSILQGIDSEKISASQKSRRAALKKYYDAANSNKNAWCIVSIPTEGWAKKVFSNVDSDIAIEKLWNAIFSVMRIYENDPVEAWNKHTSTLHNNVKKLNDYNFDYLHFTNSLGTDLRVELVDNHIWCGGEDKCQSGYNFIANMPTEEVYTTPKLNGVNGIVHSSKPLSYMGNIIEDFSITFKDGEAVNCTARTGLEYLKELIKSDSNSKYLGEVALVPFDSPISKSDIIFYNTLYDENASCHLALGSSYTCCIKDGDFMSDEELLKNNANCSSIHVDFMIGTKDTNIIGVQKDGTKIHVFKNGNWAI